jgi:hypothetical protein
MASGQLILEATVTAGTIVARGIGKLLDSSVGATVINELINAANINAEVKDVLFTDTTTELTSIPSATPTMEEMIQLIYMWVRNEVTQSGSVTTLKTDAGTTLGTSATSEAGGTVTKGKLS